MTTTRRKIEKLAIGILAVACLGLILKLAYSIAVPVGGEHAAGNSARPSKASAHEDLERFNPDLNLDELKKIEDQPFPKLARNPFEYPPPPAPPKTEVAQNNAKEVPPPPPPLPLKAIGYSVRAGGIAEAVITDDADIFVVHAGETFAKRFRVLSLTSSRVEVEDANTHQVALLPIAQ